MKRFNFIITLLFSLFLFSCQASNSSGEENVNASATVETNQDVTVVSLEVDEWYSELQSNPGVIIDVRTPGEYSEGFIEGAQLIDVSNSSFSAKVEALAIPINTPVYIYCRSGSRSKKAMNMLSSKGYTEIYELNSGILGWQKAGKPIVK